MPRSLRKEGLQHVIQGPLLDCIKTTHIRVMDCLAAFVSGPKCCGLRGRRTVRIFLLPAMDYMLQFHMSPIGEIEWGSTNGLGVGKQTRLG